MIPASAFFKPNPSSNHKRQPKLRLFARPIGLLGIVVAIFLLNLSRISQSPLYNNGSTSANVSSSSESDGVGDVWKWKTMAPRQKIIPLGTTKKIGTMSSASVSSTSSTVMGFATGYDLHVYKRFVGSLRKTGFAGNIILAVNPTIDAEVESYLLRKNVTIQKVEFVECTHQTLNASEALAAGTHGKEILSCVAPYHYLKSRWGRFPFLRDALEACETCTGPVLISDVRDTFFQCDPFGAEAPKIVGGDLQVFEEDPRIKTTNWLVEWPVRECKGISFDEPMLCSGTTVGTRQAMLDYLDIMHQEMKLWMEDPKCWFKINGDDQSIHNYLFYSGKLPFARAIPSRMGIVNTVGAQAFTVKKDHEVYTKARGIPEAEAKVYPYEGTNLTAGRWVGEKYFLTDQNGYFSNKNGRRSCVIHQYDRFGYQFERWLAKFPGFKD